MLGLKKINQTYSCAQKTCNLIADTDMKVVACNYNYCECVQMPQRFVQVHLLN